MCCYRDIKNFERFQLVVQSMICLSIVQLKNIEKLIVEHNNRISSHPSPSTPLTQHPLSTSKRVIFSTIEYMFTVAAISAACLGYVGGGRREGSDGGKCFSNPILIFSYLVFSFYSFIVAFSLHCLRRRQHQN